MPEDTKNYFQNLIQKGDYDVVLFAEQESKLLANDLELDGMNLLSQNKMKVMTKGLGEGVSYTSMSVFAKDGVDINVKKSLNTVTVSVVETWNSSWVSLVTRVA